MASFVPKTPFATEGKVCPRELLVHYSTDEEVGRQLIMNLDTGMVSETNEQKMERFANLKKQEENPIVKKRIDDYIGLTSRFDKFEKRLNERDFPEQSESEIL